jgi:hypothetical protein
VTWPQAKNWTRDELLVALTFGAFAGEPLNPPDALLPDQKFLAAHRVRFLATSTLSVSCGQEPPDLCEDFLEDPRLDALPENLDRGRIVIGVDMASHDSFGFVFP